MSKIGLMGGTFNPIHNGHITMAEYAMKEYELDKVLFVPANLPPHKQIYGNATNENRKEMVQLAIAEYPDFELSTVELDNPNPSYTYVTMLEMQKKHPADELYFIMGEDSFENFDNWVHPEIICQCAKLLVAIRSTSNKVAMIKFARKLSTAGKKYKTTFLPLHMDYMKISSTHVRELAANEKDFSANVPKDVAEYIKEHQLYLNVDTNVSISKLKKEMEKELKKDRYVHTIGVMYTAASLAMRYDCSMEDAMLAGLLHDCAKCLSDEKKISICEKNQIPIRDVERKNPQLLHAKVGAYLAENKYDVYNKDVLHAIMVHTTGCPEMSMLDMIIYISDYIEPNRNKAPRLEEIRKMAFCDIEKAVCMVLEDSMNYLSKKAASMDDVTKLTYDYYIRRVENDK